MRRIFIVAALAISVSGCSSFSDITGAFSQPQPRPQQVLSGDDQFVQAAPRQVQPIRPSRPRVIPVMAEPAPDAPDMSDAPPVEPDFSQPIVRRIAAAKQEETEADAAPAPRMRFNVAAARDQINAYRQEEGLSALVMDAALMRAAKAQSDAMARSESMDHSVGGSFAERLSDVGISDVAAAENIAAGYANVSAVIRGWQSSPAHDANLKMKEATRMGIAATPSRKQPDKLYWTLVLAGE